MFGRISSPAFFIVIIFSMSTGLFVGCKKKRLHRKAKTKETLSYYYGKKIHSLIEGEEQSYLVFKDQSILEFSCKDGGNFGSGEINILDRNDLNKLHDKTLTSIDFSEKLVILLIDGHIIKFRPKTSSDGKIKFRAIQFELNEKNTRSR